MAFYDARLSEAWPTIRTVEQRAIVQCCPTGYVDYYNFKKVSSTVHLTLSDLVLF